MVNNTWKTVKLSQIGTFQKGSGISRAESNSGALPAVRYGELYTVHNNYVRKYTSHISHEVASKALRVHYGDILFACSGETKEDIAKCAAIIDDSEVYAGGDIIVLSTTAKVDPVFLGFILNTQNVIQQRAQKAQGDAIVHISTDSIKSIEIAMPEYAEQVKIAKALYDIDTLVVNLEKLIAKKKAIKQGTMQELLTGKRRLPGYESSEWNEHRLEEICKLINGRAYAQHELLDAGKYQVLRLGNLFTNEHWYYSDLELPEKQYCVDGDLIYAWSATFGPRIWRGEKSIFHYHIWKMELSEGISKEFLYHYLCYDVRTLMAELQGGTMAHLTKGTMEKRQFVIPPYEEQCAIAEILSDMDAEIMGCEEKLLKYKRIKAGMMSELLTGRIRLI